MKKLRPKYPIKNSGLSAYKNDKKKSVINRKISA